MWKPTLLGWRPRFFVAHLSSHDRDRDPGCGRCRGNRIHLMTQHVIVTDADGIRTIRMNRPDKKNALTLAMYEAMTAALEGANADDSIRCVLIAGVPAAFSAGNDLADFRKAEESSGGLNRPTLRFLPALVRCNKPMVAAVSGVAVGVGTTMLFHCDFVVAGSDAYFSTLFVSLGLIPEAASSLLAPRLMGQRRAFEFLVMGHPLNATQAKEFGIANIVVAPEDVDTEGLKAAREIAALPAGAHRSGSQNLQRTSKFARGEGGLRSILCTQAVTSMSLKGKTLFITGASRGIGLAIARRAARDGGQDRDPASQARRHDPFGGGGNRTGRWPGPAVSRRRARRGRGQGRDRPDRDPLRLARHCR